MLGPDTRRGDYPDNGPAIFLWALAALPVWIVAGAIIWSLS